MVSSQRSKWTSGAALAALVGGLMISASLHPVPAVADTAAIWEPETSAPRDLGDAPPQQAWSPERFEDDDAIVPQARQATSNASLVRAGDLPGYSFQEFPFFDADGKTRIRVNLGTGDLLIQQNEIAVGGPGSALEIERIYSLNNHSHDIADHWSTNIGLLGFVGTANASSASFYGPTGYIATFTTDPSGEWIAPDGLNASLAFDGAGAAVVTFNRSGLTYTFENGWPRRITDRNQVGVTVSYSGEALRSVRHDNGQTAYFDKDHLNRIASMDDGGGRFVEYSHDTPGELATASSNHRGDWVFESDDFDRLTAMSRDDGKRIEFDLDGTKVTAVRQKQAGHPDVVTTFAYATAQTVVTDPRGNTSTYAVDNLGRIETATDQLGRERTQEWTPNSDVASTTDAIGTGVTTGTYDSLNNLTSQTLPTGAASQALYAQGPDCAGAQTNHPYLPKCTIDDAGNSESMTYDTAGNLTQRTNTTSGGAAETFTYTYGTACGGMAGQVCSATDGNGKTTNYTYVNGNLTKVTPPAPLGATTYAYDAINRIISVTNGANHTTGYSYDAADRIVKTTFHNSSTLVTEFNADSTVKKETDSATGTSISYTYDLLGHQTKQITASAAASEYNQMATMNYDGNGNLTRLYDSVGAAETTYTYDAANQLTRAQLQGGNCTAANSPGCIRYEYDDNALEKARIFPFGARQDTIRDDSGRPTRITTKDKNGAVQNDIAYSYAHNGADSGSVRTRTSHKEQGITAGAVTTYGYDSRSRLTSAVEKTGTTTSASWTYQYDKADNRTRQIRAGSTGATAGTVNYTYDAANRLTGATGSSGAWGYDGAGNQTRNALTGVSSTYGDRLQATANGSTTYSTFGQGNDLQLKVGNNVQKYTTLGAYSTATDRTISRDSDGTAIATRVGTTWAYLTADHLGSTTGLIGADGLYLGGYSYGPYGETRAADTNATVAGNTIRYIGQHLEPATGLYKLGARYYDASIGRFTQMDPSGQERNPYSYAACDPLNSLDPTGLAAVGTCAWFDDVSNGFGALTLGFGAVGIGATATGFGAPVGALAGVGALASEAGAWVYSQPCR